MIGPQLEELPLEEWLRLLRCQTVGRIAVVVGEFPVVIPVNYRLADIRGRNWIVIRTRPGTVLDRTSLHGAFEIDGVDPAHHQGWSVLVRGGLQRLDPSTGDLRTCFDPGPWVQSARDVWLAIDPLVITGRQLRPPEFEWAQRSTDAPLHPERATVAIAHDA